MSLSYDTLAGQPVAEFTFAGSIPVETLVDFAAGIIPGSTKPADAMLVDCQSAGCLVHLNQDVIRGVLIPAQALAQAKGRPAIPTAFVGPDAVAVAPIKLWRVQAETDALWSIAEFQDHGAAREWLVNRMLARLMQKAEPVFGPFGSLTDYRPPRSTSINFGRGINQG